MRIRDSRFCLLLLPAVWAHAAVATEMPNVVVIVADDMGWADVGYHGSPIKTPHIDRLCRQGIELNRHYVGPMCTQTRVGLLTGRYWSRFGNTSPSNSRVLPWNTPTLASLLKSAGYRTAITGKWHLGSKPECGPRKFGFDHSHGSLYGGVSVYSHQYKGGIDAWHRNDVPIQQPGHVTDLITDEAVQLIRAGFDSRPFFLYVAYTAVHDPFDEPKAYLNRCEDIDLGRRQYAASCLHLDDGVGRIVEALDQTNNRENTLIIFFSDNGGTDRDSSAQYPDSRETTNVQGLNHPLRGWKKQVYEGGIRVPACVNWPRRLKPYTLSVPVHVTDWLPTIAALVGMELPSSVRTDGRNIWPVLTGKKEPKSLNDRVIYTLGVGGRDAALHHGPWKLIKSWEGKSKPQLYRLADDPYERNDLAGRQGEIVDKLMKLLVAERARDNDALPYPWWQPVLLGMLAIFSVLGFVFGIVALMRLRSKSEAAARVTTDLN